MIEPCITTLMRYRKHGLEYPSGAFKPEQRFPQLAVNLKELRKFCCESLWTVAKACGISRTYLWELENDHKGKKQPSASVVFRLACYYTVTMENLMLETRWDILAPSHIIHAR